MDLRERREGLSLQAKRHPWELARLSIVRRLMAGALPSRSPGLIIDIGCGDAFVVEELSRAYPSAQCMAVDQAFEDEMVAALSVRLAGLKVSLFRTLDAAVAQSPHAADVVLLLDVLEHIEDDEHFLATLKRSPLIGPNTLFVVTVPAHQRLFSSHDEFLGHFRRYDAPVLLGRLAGSGFHPIHAGQFFLLGLIVRSIQAWLETHVRGRGPASDGVGTWKGGRVATFIATRALLADFACSRILRRLGIQLPGLSSYALCRASAS